VVEEISSNVCNMSFAATKVFLDKNEKTTDILGISAVIINDLKQRRQRDYEFDWNRALQVKSSSVVTCKYIYSNFCLLILQKPCHMESKVLFFVNKKKKIGTQKLLKCCPCHDTDGDVSRLFL
jgi:arginyl-tRNA synthetase